ncbi:hypothetical protein GCM10009745_66820 [Kribbella yunnanensis]|uniref:Uncharacterized protein n=1 Tax=Kribbella yunnanensis TaxID=190194 RepID=A0ABP4UPV1_9ACTN
MEDQADSGDTALTCEFVNLAAGQALVGAGQDLEDGAVEGGDDGADRRLQVHDETVVTDQLRTVIMLTAQPLTAPVRPLTM